MGEPTDYEAPHYAKQPDTFELYLVKALQTPGVAGVIDPPCAALSDARSDSSSSFTLTKGQTNRILFFTGCFNPPHQGHLRMVQHMFDMRKQLNIVAILIFSQPDEAKAINKKHGSIIVPRETRNEMWTSELESSSQHLRGWMWVLDSACDRKTGEKLANTLSDLIVEAGFDAQVVRLIGGDKITAARDPRLDTPASAFCGGNEMIITNAARDVDFFDRGLDKSPRAFPGCTGWERDGLENAGDPWTSWSCKSLGIPGRPLFRFVDRGEVAVDEISSTQVRQIISETPHDQLFQVLAPLVLGPTVLVEWLNGFKHLGARNKDSA